MGQAPGTVPSNKDIVASANTRRRLVISSAAGVYESEIIAPKFSAARAQNGQLSVSIDNPLAEEFLLESSLNLQDWSSVATSSENQIEQPTGHGALFYRLRVP